MLRSLAPLFALVALPGCNPFGLWDEPEPETEPEVLDITVGADGDTLAGLTDYARADGAPCARTDSGCVHVGASRTARIALDSCDGIHTTDALDLFTWSCSDDGDGVTVRGTLRADRGLAELLDTDALALRENRIDVRRGGALVARSRAAVWWPTAVRPAVAPLDEPDTVYVVTNAAVPLGIGADHVAIVTAPGVTLAGNGSTDALGDYVGRAFVWIEGDYRAADEEAIDVRGAAYLLVRRVHTSGARGTFVEGLAVDGTHLTLQDVVTEGTEIGVRVSASDHVRVRRVRAAGNAFGLAITDVTDLVATDVTVVGASSIGIDLNGGGDHRWRGVLVAACNFGFSVQDSADLALADVTTLANTNGGVVLFNALRLSLAGHLSINDESAVRIDTRAASAPDLPHVADVAVIGSTNAFSLLDGDVTILVPSSALYLDPASACVREIAGVCPSFATSAAPPVTETIAATDVGADPLLIAAALPGALTDVAARGPCDAACTDIDVSLRTDSVFIDVHALDVLATDTAPPALAHAREDSGDDDGRCEAREACTAAPNLGAYQGHGALLPAKDVTAGATTFSVSSHAANGV